MRLYTHPDCEKHDMPGHPERPDRLRSIMQRLHDSRLIDELTLITAQEISTNMIEQVHPADYIRSIADAEPSSGIIKLDPDTYMSPGSLRASKLAAGACVQATQDVLGGITHRAFCAIRPPGHHAELASAMGFCLFNNVAIAAEVALANPSIERVAIVDFDVHHCNGTVDIFKDRPEVLVCSSFQDHFYPHRYLDFSNDHIISTPLPEGAGSVEFRSAIEAQWLPALEHHRPNIIFISAGFDAHRDDPLGNLNLGEADYDWVTRFIGNMANSHSQGRIISTLEGGYDLEALAASTQIHITALMDSAG